MHAIHNVLNGYYLGLLPISESAIRECGSTLYVGLQHAVPPTNTKFKPLLLPTQAGICYTSTKHHISSLHLTHTSGALEVISID